MLVPIRQFLEEEEISVPKEKIDARIENLKQDPNPFGGYRPIPLIEVMVRECITWEDLRLMITADMGMSMWVERQWQEEFPTPESWTGYCREKDAECRGRFGKFVIIPFTMNHWPEGAKNETEARSILKKQAETAKEQLTRGTSTDPSIQELEPRVIPFSYFGEDQASHLRELTRGHVSRPLETRFGWYLLKRDSMTAKDVSDLLKDMFLSDAREETENRISTEAVIEETPSGFGYRKMRNTPGETKQSP
jgi:parvulin-like peptidyl-prolyl isomerase